MQGSCQSKQIEVLVFRFGKDRLVDFCSSKRRIRPSVLFMNPPYVDKYLLGDPEVTVNLYCNFAYLYWEGCVICSIYLR